MISLGIAILPTSCSSAPNSRLRRRSGVEASRRPTSSASSHDAAAVLARVAVVGLDDVAEDQRRAAVGVVELDEPAPRARGARGRRREQREQRDQRERPPTVVRRRSEATRGRRARARRRWRTPAHSSTCSRGRAAAQDARSPRRRRSRRRSCASRAATSRAPARRRRGRGSPADDGGGPTENHALPEQAQQAHGPQPRTTSGTWRRSARRARRPGRAPAAAGRGAGRRRAASGR